MIELKDKIRGWNIIQQYLNKVRDYKYRTALTAELAARAEKYWGWAPVKVKETTPELDEWEQEFSRQIDVAIQFGIKPKNFGGEKHRCLCEMTRFVRAGGMLSEIPPEIRTPEIEKLYWEVHEKEHKGVMEVVDAFINRLKHP